MSAGFSVAYFQVPWATKSGGLEVMGVEAACVSFVLGCRSPANTYDTESVLVCS